MIRVLLVDDQALQRMGMLMFLSSQPDIDVAGEAADGVEAVRLVSELNPDVVLMDIRMPGMDGIAATAHITGGREGSAAGPRVLLLTTFDVDEYVLDGVQAGASGFLTKDAEPAELLAGIRAVASGDAVLAPSATRRLLHRLTDPGIGSREPADGNSDQQAAARVLVDQLTEREREILTAIGRGHTNREIQAAMFLAESTVKGHVGRILLKLGARDRVHAVIIAFRAGLVGRE
ncbi:response regulator [Bogoriella caseilytica]|uniref:LuxR family two component transcriptional regulator n=1 Tax=Bogoriella caseilytica TaxID=56055 RepID=A0A3N2BCI6_9MICO|nr:response regulator transcription factor [Bogoriella caseilytica]ROR72774.1 LuxR family two component transcriptional regulator [Bogoriella caseilytica]